MADDLEELLKRAMKTLDDEVPSGYFDGLPRETLSRLETMMQPTTGSGGIKRPGLAPPERATPVPAPDPAAPREEDSGLHDIRELARSSKARISQKRTTSHPPMDPDVLSSSGAWKAVALPEPAKMVSLPALADLPSAKDIRKADKAARKDKQAAVAATAVATSTPSLPSAPRASRTKIYAIGGVAVAAAAAVTIFFALPSSKSEMKTSNSSAHADVALAERPTTPRVVATPAPAPKPEPPPVAAAQPETPAPPPPVDEAPIATPPAADVKPGKHTVAVHGKAPAKVATKNDPAPPAQKADKPEAKPQETKAPSGGNAKKKGGEDEPNFDDLLKEAGVDPNKQKPKKPTLANKELSGDDFKRGMGSVASRAQACYKGTQGNAIVKLTIAPSGKITKVAVSGQFSGKPEAECVANAVRNVTFSPWDGQPQTMSYSYLLSE